MELNRINIYRLTHIKNISHVLEYGITHKNSINNNTNYIPIGDISLINTRNNKSVSVDNGDFLSQNSPSIVLGDYIPFYFGIKMPMLYVAQQGGNFVMQATQPKDIIYIACSLEKIINSEIEYFFSDGHATDNLTTFYDSSSVNELPNIIDWNSVKAPFWGGQENLNIKRKKQAELLISSDLPPEFIIGYVCYSQEAKEQLIKIGVDENLIKIIPNAYF